MKIIFRYFVVGILLIWMLVMVIYFALERLCVFLFTSKIPNRDKEKIFWIRQGLEESDRYYE